MSRPTRCHTARVARGVCLLAALLLVAGVSNAVAQTRFSYLSGQSLEPAYEGWWKNEDGSFTMFFGYMNTNWQQEFDIPVGPDNHFEPGEPDRGQPTHFYPRRNPFLFTIQVPKDFGTQEIVWTLTANGQTRKAYASLKTDYLIDKQVISTEVGGDNGSLANELRQNTPPDLKLEGADTRTVTVGQPLSVVALVGDPDNYPPRRDGKPQPGVKKPLVTAVPSSARQANREDPTSNNPSFVYKPTTSTNESSGPGLRFSWTVYRGKRAAVNFKPDQLEAWIDTRSYAHSPWAPPYIIPVPPADGRYVTEVVFSEPGTYVLRGIASDSALFTHQDLTVTVKP